MIRGIHYFSTELKRKLMSSQGAALKVWTKHNFYYIQYISVYIQPKYIYLIFRGVNSDQH